jgi:hypothetical protein
MAKQQQKEPQQYDEKTKGTQNEGPDGFVSKIILLAGIKRSMIFVPL